MLEGQLLNRLHVWFLAGLHNLLPHLTKVDPTRNGVAGHALLGACEGAMVLFFLGGGRPLGALRSLLLGNHPPSFEGASELGTQEGLKVGGNPQTRVLGPSFLMGGTRNGAPCADIHRPVLGATNLGQEDIVVKRHAKLAPPRLAKPLVAEGTKLHLFDRYHMLAGQLVFTVRLHHHGHHDFRHLPGCIAPPRVVRLIHHVPGHSYPPQPNLLLLLRVFLILDLWDVHLIGEDFGHHGQTLFVSDEDHLPPNVLFDSLGHSSFLISLEALVKETFLAHAVMLNLCLVHGDFILQLLNLGQVLSSQGLKGLN